jgi:hypothetical protein
MAHNGRMTRRFESSEVTTLRRAIMARGQSLATLLSQVLAGKQPPGLAALLAAKPGIRPEEALRRALDQIERRRVLLDAGDERFGCCESCGADLGIERLREMPWADRCNEHAAG